MDYLSIPVKAGWNIIGSLSTAFDVTKIQEEPADNVISSYFGYNNGYQTINTLAIGGGYWVKVDQPGRLILDVATMNNNPPPITQEQPPPSPTAPPIPNLSSPTDGSTNVSVSPVLSWYPSSGATKYHLQVSRYTGFSPLVYDNSSITMTAKIPDMLSTNTTYYWRVRASNEMEWSNWSTIWYFTTESAPPDPCDPSYSLTSLDQIAITDASGNKQEMYARHGGRALNLGVSDTDMPPEPRSGIFNVRFQSGKFIEAVQLGQGRKHIPIKIKDAEFPITLLWSIRPENGLVYEMVLGGEGNPRIPLTGEGSIVLDGTDNGVIMLDAQIDAPPPGDPDYKTSFGSVETESISDAPPIPEQFFIAEAFPNPFNPSTTIYNGMKEDSRVVMKVYNSFGQEVRTLVDEFQTAGYRNVRFDASSLSSGIYFCRMQTSNFIGTQKLMLVK